MKSWLWIVTLLIPAGCAARQPPAYSADTERLARFERQLAEADRAAARGCYLCLKEAAGLYTVLAEESSAVSTQRKAIENDLMIVLRERELRLPDSGALERAGRSPLRDDYALYFSAIDAFGESPVAGRQTYRELQQFREKRQALADELEQAWPESPMKAYFYVAAALGSSRIAELKPQIDGILNTHATSLSLQYRMQAFVATFSEQASRDLLSKEPGFGEINFVIAQHAILGGQLLAAFRELRRSRELLPDSGAINLVFGNVELALARYPEALADFDRVLAASPEDEDAQLGRAKALSYLKRHGEALIALELLLRDTRSNPGEKYYWRAWNRLRLGHTEDAYEDATTALKVIANVDVFRLAGITSFAMNRFDEARRRFDSALEMQPGDCDSIRYLAQIDALEKSWKPAADRFTRAGACYGESIVRMSKDLAEKEDDISGLSNGLIAALRADIDEAHLLQQSAVTNASTAVRNVGR